MRTTSRVNDAAIAVCTLFLAATDFRKATDSFHIDSMNTNQATERERRVYPLLAEVAASIFKTTYTCGFFSKIENVYQWNKVINHFAVRSA